MYDFVQLYRLIHRPANVIVRLLVTFKSVEIYHHNNKGEPHETAYDKIWKQKNRTIVTAYIIQLFCENKDYPSVQIR